MTDQKPTARQILLGSSTAITEMLSENADRASVCSHVATQLRGLSKKVGDLKVERYVRGNPTISPVSDYLDELAAALEKKGL